MVLERGNPWGLHRVCDTTPVLPQAALKLNNALPLFDNEILVELEALQIDSASFHALEQKEKIDRVAIETQVMEIISSRGKMHNPVTNSGGVFLGKVIEVGKKHPDYGKLKKNERIISLVSLTLTPLHLEKITAVDKRKERLSVTGHAILFETGLYSLLPDDLPQGVVLAALDVCGAPAQAKRHVGSCDTVMILGLGKAGKSIALMCEQLGARVLGLDAREEAVNWCRQHIRGTFAKLDVTNPVLVTNWVLEHNAGKLVDKAFHATNVESTEMAGILPVKDGGTALFFGMATAFGKVVLGAEGVGKDITLLMGSGYVPGHAALMLGLVRNNKPYRDWLGENYGL
ncbi:L-erythro-3,5-diaminohexanoate dehydrogenase [bacterium]|nr:L-erythro-3,5-diaminohexanoate dehydrogenase [bacterium]